MTILVGHVLDMLPTIESGSVHTCVTSPPYYRLRNYELPPVVWGGDPSHHHEWDEVFTPNQNTGGGVTLKQKTNRGSYSTGQVRDGGPLPRKIAGKRGHTSWFCACGAWRGCLGLEAVSDCLAWARGESPCACCFVCHLRTIFAGVRRVLRDDGTLWLNLGDSYNGSGGSGGDYGPGGRKDGRPKVKGSKDSGLKPKDLMLVPHRVALALQADGWYLRSEFPWVKGSAMVESVTDRPPRAHEHFFLLSKRKHYFYDSDATRVPYADCSLGQLRGGYEGKGRKAYELAGVQNPSDVKRRAIEAMAESGGRNRRTSDWFNESLDRQIEDARRYLQHLETIRGKKGMLCDESGDPLAINVNPKPSREDHYAAYCGDLIRPLLKSGTSEAGCCSECGKPWERVVVDSPEYASIKAASDWKQNRGGAMDTGNEFGRNPHQRVTKDSVTLGWEPTCSHDAETVPCQVLDPFMGSGTTALVAEELGLRWVGIEASEEYAAIAERRIRESRAQLKLFSPVESKPAKAESAQPSLSLFDTDAAA